MINDINSNTTAKGKGGERGICFLHCLPSGGAARSAEALPQEVARHITCWWEVENKIICFPLYLYVQTLAFALVNCPIST